MEVKELKAPFKTLVEKGKASGKLTTQEIDTVIIEMDLDIEELDKLYETLEANNIEIVDDLSSAAIENFDVDLPKSLDIGGGDDKGMTVDDPSRFILRKSAEFPCLPPKKKSSSPSEFRTMTSTQNSALRKQTFVLL